MNIQPKSVFLIDAIGALISALSLGVLLVQFQEYVGMPTSILYKLAIIAAIFCIYSSMNYIKTPNNWKPYLLAIAISNSLYAVLTSILIIYFYDMLTAMGLTYFFLEILVLALLVSFELRIILKQKLN